MKNMLTPYNIETFLIWDDKAKYYDVFESKFFKMLAQLPIKGTYIIEEDKKYRPDLISYHIYGTVDLWWQIMYYNGIINSYDLHPNIELKYFDKNDYDMIYLDYQRMLRQSSK